MSEYVGFVLHDGAEGSEITPSTISLAFAITDDHNTFQKYENRWREAGQFRFQTIALRDGGGLAEPLLNL